MNDDVLIPFNRATIQGRELEHVREAIDGGHISGDGRFSRLCQDLLQRELGATKVLLTPSGTHALEIAALLLDLEPGDEVVVPAFTFVSTANAFALRGARITFVDVRDDTLNLDERQLEAAITERTRAIVPVHYAGVACDMDAILAIADRHGVTVVEDAAHAPFGTYKGRPLGSIAPMAALSFHETKNLTCGEGGAFVANAPEFVERAEIHRDKGTDRSRFLRGQVERYTWMDLGSSYVLSDILAAFLYGQLEQREEIALKRRQVWERYQTELRDWAERHGVRQPHVPETCVAAHHLYHLRLPTPEDRDRLLDHLRAHGIHAVFHYQPLHRSKFGVRYGERACPVTEAVCDRLLRLPLYNDLGEAEQQRILDVVRTWPG